MSGPEGSEYIFPGLKDNYEKRRGGKLREGVLESVGKFGGVNGGVDLGGQSIPCKVFCVGSGRIQNRERGTGTETVEDWEHRGEIRKTNAKGSYVEGRVCIYAVFVFDISPSCFLSFC